MCSYCSETSNVKLNVKLCHHAWLMMTQQFSVISTNQNREASNITTCYITLKKNKSFHMFDLAANLL